MISQNGINFNCYLNWSDIDELVQKTVKKVENRRYDTIIGITNGGIIPARLIAREIDVDNIYFIYMLDKKVQNDLLPVFSKDKKYLIVDDIYDTGYTYTIVSQLLGNITIGCDFMFLLSRYEIKNDLIDKNSVFVGDFLNHDKWIVFPWEKN
ncbi:MAG: hypothetical protein DA328_03800 [Nitrososphaeraceae archaeon]|nr:hypothetical protein [Nitrososphaeraceae archaeon]